MDSLAKRAMAMLEKHYPDWKWAIIADHNNLMLSVISERFGPEWGYKLRVLDIQNDPTDNWALRAGSEILKRFGMELKGWRPQADKWASMPKLMDGSRIPDLGDTEDRRLKSQMELSERLVNGDISLFTAPDGKQYLGVRK